ncbi:hypothetical protein Syun_009614 [Stephania yunnanensis]|uniref:Uncharacterized protein n=1 Tax=Stephania yunnanensis TaxID=152371 RepID=A0AAP0KHG8_9MAGN
MAVDERWTTAKEAAATTSGSAWTDQRARWLGQAAARERKERRDVAEADRWRQRGGTAASGAEADGGWR